MNLYCLSSAFVLLLLSEIGNVKSKGGRSGGRSSGKSSSSGGYRSGSSSSSKSKGSSSSGSSSSGSSYPRQQWEPAKPSYGSSSYGQPVSNYGQPSAPSYGQPSRPSYGQPAHNYGQPTYNYGQPAANYGQPAHNYGQPIHNYGQSSKSKAGSHVAAGLAGAYIAHKAHKANDAFNTRRIHHASSHDNDYGRDFDSHRYKSGYHVSTNHNDPGSYGTGVRGPQPAKNKPIIFLSVESRLHWGARPPKKYKSRIEKYFTHVIVHHSDTEDCYNRTACVSELLNIQNQHMDVKGFADIGFNFLIGGDGRVFEGLGWTRISAITNTTLDPHSLQIAFLGNFSLYPPTFAQLESFDALLQYADKKDYLKSFLIHGHRDVACTTCPGEALYILLIQTNGYSSLGNPALLCPGGVNVTNATSANVFNHNVNHEASTLRDPFRLPQPTLPSIYPSINIPEVRVPKLSFKRIDQGEDLSTEDFAAVLRQYELDLKKQIGGF